MNKLDFITVGIGASAGGHQALEQFFKSVPWGTPAAFVVVTHLARSHTSALPRIISRFSQLPVLRIEHGMELKPGAVFVMPEGVVLTLRNNRCQLTKRAEGNVINRCIDIFLTSLAQEKKRNATAVILSGMGSDGAEGCLRIFSAGGHVYVQDPGTTPFKGMPWASIANDHPDAILPPDEIGKQLVHSIKMKTGRVDAPSMISHTAHRAE